MSATTNALPIPEVFYQPHGKGYFRRDSNSRFIQVDRDGAKKFLARSGFSPAAGLSGISPADEAILTIQEDRNVVYAAPLAGHRAGLCQIDGERILVTDSPRMIDPVAGGWPLLRRILEGMFRTEQLDQTPYLYGWLKLASAGLRSGTRSPGQVLAIAGPVRAGKTLIQGLITELLGGRSAFPYQFMTGETQFNADLFRAEHLVVDDQAESTNIAARRHFGAAIKQVTSTRQHRCHPKNATPVTLEPFWRMTMTLNDDPERLLVLPPLDGDINDKIMLLKASRLEMPMPTDTSAQQEAFRRALTAELPAFVHFLDQWEIPKRMRASRFGIATFHHPDLVQKLSETTPESQLMELIDNVLFRVPETTLMQPSRVAVPWVGTAAQLRARLVDDTTHREQARDLLKNVNQCGTYLRRLEDAPGSRIRSQVRTGTRNFTILPPTSGGTVEQVSESIMAECVKEEGEAGVEHLPMEQSGQNVPPFHRDLLPRVPLLPCADNDPARN